MNDSFHATATPTPPIATSATEINVDEVLESARHLCEETRVVLTSLRGGPPNVARGDLAQDLVDLRQTVKTILSTDMSVLAADLNTSNKFDSYQNDQNLASAGLDPLGASVSTGGTDSSTNATTNATAGRTASSAYQNVTPSSPTPSRKKKMKMDLTKEVVPSLLNLQLCIKIENNNMTK